MDWDTYNEVILKNHEEEIIILDDPDYETLAEEADCITTDAINDFLQLEAAETERILLLEAKK